MSVGKYCRDLCENKQRGCICFYFANNSFVCDCDDDVELESFALCDSTAGFTTNL